MKYLSFIRSSEKYRSTPPPAALMEAMGKFLERTLEDKSLVSTGGLAPSQDGFRLRLSNGTISTTDGPFSEAKEVIGGWAILQGETKADVVRVSTEFLELHRKHWPDFECECEVRLMEAGFEF
jgi:hypothetical protein